MTDAENMAEELHALAMMTEGSEREYYMERYTAIVTPVTVGTDDCGCDWNGKEYPRCPHDASGYCGEPGVPGIPSDVNAYVIQDDSRIPCPRCGQLAELRSPAGRREEWECPACGFGFDLPADPVE